MGQRGFRLDSSTVPSRLMPAEPSAALNDQQGMRRVHVSARLKRLPSRCTICRNTRVGAGSQLRHHRGELVRGFFPGEVAGWQDRQLAAGYPDGQVAPLDNGTSVSAAAAKTRSTAAASVGSVRCRSTLDCVGGMLHNGMADASFASQETCCNAARTAATNSACSARLETLIRWNALSSRTST